MALSSSTSGHDGDAPWIVMVISNVSLGAKQRFIVLGTSPGPKPPSIKTHQNTPELPSVRNTP